MPNSASIVFALPSRGAPCSSSKPPVRERAAYDQFTCSGEKRGCHETMSSFLSTRRAANSGFMRPARTSCRISAHTACVASWMTPRTGATTLVTFANRPIRQSSSQVRGHDNHGFACGSTSARSTTTPGVT
jgi:hypothetical protein